MSTRVSPIERVRAEIEGLFCSDRELGDWDNYPPEKVAFFMRSPTWCRKKAAELGPNVADLVAELLCGGALHHLRAAQGVIGLADKHGDAHLDAACARAVSVDNPSCRTVNGILAADTETEQAVASLPPAAAWSLGHRSR